MSQDLGPIGTALETLATEATKLRAEVAAAERKRKFFQLLLVGFVVALLVVVSGEWLSIAQGHRTGDRIESCTTPGGECYQRGQQQTGRAIGQLISAQESIAECEKSTSTAVELRSCVAAKLATPSPSKAR